LFKTCHIDVTITFNVVEMKNEVTFLRRAAVNPVDKCCWLGSLCCISGCFCRRLFGAGGFSPNVMLIFSLSQSVFCVEVPGGVTGVASTEANVFVVTVLVLVSTRVATSGGAVVAWHVLWLSSLLTVVVYS